MDGSLPPPLLQNRACHFCGTRLLSDAPFVMRHLSSCCKQPSRLMICRFAPLPCGTSLPHAAARVLALLQRYSLRSPAHHRPHVSISEALPSALASCGIPPDTACGWHLLMKHESPYQVTPFPVPMVRIRRAVLSTGFLGSAYRSDFRLPAPYPVPCGSSASASCAGSF
jgi:hypothetical protein